MSAQSSVLAPGRKGQIAHEDASRPSMTWLAFAAVVALLVSLGAWSIVAGQTATTTVAPVGGGGHPAPLTSRFDQASATTTVAPVGGGGHPAPLTSRFDQADIGS
jgi:hypothetical protein